MIMYCAMATTFGSLGHSVIESALPHAVTLAESGGTIQNKRIGEHLVSEMRLANLKVCTRLPLLRTDDASRA